MKRFFTTSFGSALLGGVVVAAFGWVAIAAGWIHADSNGSTVTVAEPLTAPVDASEENGDGNLVNQIYRRDGQGVAFISSELKPEESSGLSPFGEPEGGGSRDRLGLPDRHRRPHRHQQPRGRRGRQGRGQTRLLGQDLHGRSRRHRPGDRRRAAQGRRPGRQPPPARARRLVEGRGRRTGRRDRQPVRPRPDGDGGHRLRHPAPDPGAQRVLDLARDPDRRGDQPRQLRRAADRHPKAR